MQPDDASSAAATHFALAQRAFHQGQWDKAQIESERALTLAETFRPDIATKTAHAQHLAAYQQYNQFYVSLLMRQHFRQPSSGWAVRAWEANERAHWHRWRQTLLGIAGQSSRTESANVFQDVLTRVQQRLRNDQSILLEYALGEPHSYVWLLDGRDITTYKLPARVVIEKQAQLVYRQLSQPASRQTQADAQALKKLSEWLLRPVNRTLPGNIRRMLLVTDSSLQRIPFSVLAHQAKDRAAGFALAQYEMTYVPTALFWLEGSAAHKALSAGVAVVADPVFGKYDERLNAPDRLPTLAALFPRMGQTARFQRAVQNSTMATTVLMPRLAFARYEAENVTRWFAPTTALCALGFAATRQLALDGRLADYPIIHFATHGYSNSLHPEQSGLVLSQVNERGDAQEGVLQLRDICRLDLPAELIVLSACESGVTKTPNPLLPSASVAEGFLFAGAHRVLSTLWPVNDAATAELMKYFYEALLGEQHLEPAAALRQAQLLLARNTRWQHPYYWAAFVLQGEY